MPGFDDLIGALQLMAGSQVRAEVLEGDGQVVAEIYGDLGEISLGEDLGQGGRGVGWVPIGPEPRLDRGSGVWIDVARFRDAELAPGVIRCRFGELTYIITA